MAARTASMRLRTDVRRVEHALDVTRKVLDQWDQAPPRHLIDIMTPLVNADIRLCEVLRLVQAGGWWGRAGGRQNRRGHAHRRAT